MSGDPLADYNAYEAAQERKQRRYPRCDNCDNYITDMVFHIEGLDYCLDCLKDLYGEEVD